MKLLSGELESIARKSISKWLARHPGWVLKLARNGSAPRTSSSLPHLLEWTRSTYDSVHDCVVSSTIEAIGLLCGREVANDVLRKVGNRAK